MDSHRKSRFIGASLILLLSLTTGASGDNQCESINTEINSVFSSPPAPCMSPLSTPICTTGTIAGGLLKGTTSFTALTLNLGPAPSTMVYAGTLSITTGQGTLNISDVGVLDTTNHVFSEIDRIESGTEIFSAAKGILFISGNETATGFTGKVSGRVCLRSEQ